MVWKGGLEAVGRARIGTNSLDAEAHDRCLLRQPPGELYRYSRRVRPSHSVIRTFEPGEDWFWNYTKDEAFEGPPLAPPEHHPLDQPVPGPAGRVPRDWQRYLH